MTVTPRKRTGRGIGAARDELCERRWERTAEWEPSAPMRRDPVAETEAEEGGMK